MLAGFMIALREGLEAALIVGIVLGVLRKTGRSDRRGAVWAGVASAVAVSIVGGLMLNCLGLALEGRAEAIFEGIAMLLAAGVLTWMILWMHRQGGQLRSALEQDTRQRLETASAGPLFTLAFVTVVREGIETVLFLMGAALSASWGDTLAGAALGLLTAVALGWMIFAAGRRLDLRAFFAATGVLLILFAAGLLAHGVHELQMAGLLPVVVEQMWDLGAVLDPKSVGGGLLRSLFGYNANPSLLEVVGYMGYLALVGGYLVLSAVPRTSEQGGVHA